MGGWPWQEVHAAVDADELERTTDVESLARTVDVVVSGALMTWAFHQESSAEDWIRGNVDAVIKPHLAARLRASRSDG